MKFLSESEVELRWAAPTNPDLEVVNAARVSFGKQKTEIDSSDIKLINYLAEHKHMSPFRHPQISFRIKTPEIVARQFYKHVIGCHYTSETSTTIDHAWNEISGRYVVLENEFYLPKEFRKQSKSNKQASQGTFAINEESYLQEQYKLSIVNSYLAYQNLIDKGVAKELARSLMPVCFYTEFIWTASLEAIINFIKLRTHAGAQKEIQEVAEQIFEIIKTIAPISTEALMKEGL